MTTISKILADPAASTWLKTALGAALTRDPVDAANDAELLARALAGRAKQVLSESIRRRAP